MSQRQFARKLRPPAERNLRLVPPPKPKRRPKRRWKIGRILKWKYDQQTWLHAYEEELVLAAMRARNGVASIATLCAEEPERWNPSYLRKTFWRLRRAGKVAGPRYNRGGHFGSQLTYTIVEDK